MSQRLTAVLLVTLVLGAVGFYSSAYVIKEGQQAVITQFGRPVGSITDAGLHFKTPFIQEVHLLEKRLLPWDGAAENMQTRDKKRIFIDVWARWRVSDVEKFYKAHRTEQNGQKILDDLVNAAVRNVVAQNNLIDVVRSTNDELVYESEEMMEVVGSSESTRDVVTSSRGEMEETILQTVNGDLEKNTYGMQLAAVRIKRVNYVETVKDTVYERMRSERLRIARLYESEAEEAKNRIEGLTRKELDQIDGEMEQKSAEIRGKAEAAVIEMTREAYSQSPEFYTLLRYLEVYKATLNNDTRLILTTDSDLFRLLKTIGDGDTGAVGGPSGTTPPPGGQEE
jgi:membrane protease subunit HflC